MQMVRHCVRVRHRVRVVADAVGVRVVVRVAWPGVGMVAHIVKMTWPGVRVVDAAPCAAKR